MPVREIKTIPVSPAASSTNVEAARPYARTHRDAPDTPPDISPHPERRQGDRRLRDVPVVLDTRSKRERRKKRPAAAETTQPESGTDTPPGVGVDVYV